VRRKPEDLSGRRYGALTVLGPVIDRRWYWHCICRCGAKRQVRADSLRAGITTRCMACSKTSHGYSRTSEYVIWIRMRSRCYNSNHVHFSDYGGRLVPIKVCDRWLKSFDNFLADMGRRPGPNYTLDRKNNNGNYSKSNCRWATKSEQSNNRRNNVFVRYAGRRITLAMLADRLGIKRNTLYERYRRGDRGARLVRPV